MIAHVALNTSSGSHLTLGACRPRQSWQMHRKPTTNTVVKGWTGGSATLLKETGDLGQEGPDAAGVMCAGQSDRRPRLGLLTASRCSLLQQRAPAHTPGPGVRRRSGGPLSSLV